MKTFDLYEFVGLIVPGTLLMVAYEILFAGSAISSLPANIGGLGVYVIVAYGLGHLVQAVGYGLETIYWKAWQGRPTEWPVTKSSWDGAPRAVRSVTRATGVTIGEEIDTALWISLVGEVRSRLYATGRAARLQVFVSNYGLFRGVLAAVAVIAAVAWASDSVGWVRAYGSLLVVGVLAERRLHRFAVHYARELFSSAAALEPCVSDRD